LLEKVIEFTERLNTNLPEIEWAKRYK